MPTVSELNKIKELKHKSTGIPLFEGIYWSATSRENGKHCVVDFLSSDEPRSVANNKKNVASYLLVKNF